MTVRMRVIADDKEMRDDLFHVRDRLAPVAHVQAMNRANQFCLDQIIIDGRKVLMLGTEKLQKQIRIPPGFRASIEKPDAGGVYGAFVPAINGVPGETFQFTNTRPHFGARVSGTFEAKMRSGHSGLFVRVLTHPDRRREFRSRRTNLWRITELPISEVFVNAIEELHPVVENAIVSAGPVYEDEFAVAAEALFSRG